MSPRTCFMGRKILRRSPCNAIKIIFLSAVVRYVGRCYELWLDLTSFTLLIENNMLR